MFSRIGNLIGYLHGKDRANALFYGKLLVTLAEIGGLYCCKDQSFASEKMLAQVKNTMWGKRAIPPPAETTDPGDLDDVQQLRAAQHDLTLFAPVYERYVDRIYTYCRYRVGENEAEDVTSQVFVRALKGLAGYRGGSVAAWLFRIAHNCVVDHLSYRCPQVSLDEHELDLPADTVDLFDQVADAERLALLRRIITSLFDEAQISLLTLKLTSGLSSAEIGEVVGKSAVAVRVEISRMLRQIRTRYQALNQEVDS